MAIEAITELSAIVRWNMMKLDETERLDSMLGSVSGIRLTYAKLKK